MEDDERVNQQDSVNPDGYHSQIEIVLENDEVEERIILPEQNTDQWIKINPVNASSTLVDSETVTVDAFENDAGTIYHDEDSVIDSKELEIVDQITSTFSEGIDEALFSEDYVKMNEEDVLDQKQESDQNSSYKAKYFYVWKLRIPRVLKPAFIAFLSFLVFGFFLTGTKLGNQIIFRLTANYISTKVAHQNSSDIVLQEEVDEVEENASDKIITPQEDIKLNAQEGSIRNEDYVVNILLLGEEAIGAGLFRGRTDLIMIATMNAKQKRMKLTSIMRDTYVQIPGFKDNKINAAYQIGGVDLLSDTIELNFDVKIDGFCLVGFDSFQKIIDDLGGIDIEVTQTEADWLNKTNYITEISNRNLFAGVNHLNGDQALGYCRIRQVGTKGKEYDDFGRTSRQKTVLNAVIQKYKSLSLIDLMVMANKIFPVITTDITSSEMAKYMEMAFDIGFSDIENYRIPAAGTFRSTYVRDMSVLVPNLSENVSILQKYIFGEEDQNELK